MRAQSAFRIVVAGCLWLWSDRDFGSESPAVAVSGCFGRPARRSGPRAAVNGVSHDAVPTDYLKPPSPVQETLGLRRPSGWVLAKTDSRGPGRGGVVHAVDCDEAPAGAPALPLDRALDAAEQPGVRLCSLCGAAAIGRTCTRTNAVRIAFGGWRSGVWPN
ncbi:DUF6233 domain-containing protein [Streptomyces sp. NPDC093260]|uniref:DUF6233 domain-containing protein n=1 Tax=Streptomyces sp. NPDC093260 TaxID=3155073 RepID=UPI003446FD1D